MSCVWVILLYADVFLFHASKWKCFCASNKAFLMQVEIHLTVFKYFSFFPIQDSPNKEGIIRNSSKGHPELYKNYENRTDVSLTEEGSLVLKNVNFSQAGRYMCHLAAEVGHRNNDSYVILNVSGNLWMWMAFENVYNCLFGTEIQPGQFSSELVEYSCLLVILQSTNSKVVMSWPWPSMGSL